MLLASPLATMMGMAKRKPKTAGTADSVVEGQLHHCLGEIENELDSHCLAVIGPIQYGLDDLIREAVENRVKVSPKRRKLAVVLETSGGYIEVTQRIVRVMRHHYKHVSFIVPNFAMSAGTVLVLSGDVILMDYYSVLGPIDPQVQNEKGRSVAALGYLEKYQELIEKSKQKSLTTAELAFLVQRFDPGELYAFEQARELSVSLLIDWLTKYKFKNWKQTQSKKTPVTAAMRKARAKEIAELLNKTDEWHSHGHGISMEVLRRNVKLLIDDLGKQPELHECVKEYHSLLRHYMVTTGQKAAIHVTSRYIGVR